MSIHVRVYLRTNPDSQDNMVELFVYPMTDADRPAALAAYLQQRASDWLTKYAGAGAIEIIEPDSQPRPPLASIKAKGE